MYNKNGIRVDKKPSKLEITEKRLASTQKMLDDMRKKYESIRDNKAKLRGKELTTFAIADGDGEYNVFRILGTTHSLERIEEYGLNGYHISGSLLSLGDKLNQYNNSGQHILLPDENKGVSVVFTVEDYIVVLITVIHSGETWGKIGTVIEKIS